MFKTKKSQAAMEYLIVSAVLIMIILPAVYVFYNYSHTTTKEISLARVNDIGKKIIHTAEQVYFLGEDSKITMIVNMPEDIEDISILPEDTKNIYELVFNIAETEVVFWSDVPIREPKEPNMVYDETTWSPGQKEITLEAKVDSDYGVPYFVEVQIK